MDNGYLLVQAKRVGSIPRPHKPTVPQYMKGTLTASDYNSAQTLIFTIVLYKSRTVASFNTLRISHTRKLRLHCSPRALMGIVL